MVDTFGPQATHPSSPGRKAFVITPSDTVDLDYQTRALNLQISGVVRVLLADDTDPVDLYLVAGVLHPLAVKRVYATGTDGGLSIKGIY